MNHRPIHADPHQATANLEMSTLSERLQENELGINRPTQEEDAAAYTTLQQSNVRKNHVYDVISR